MINTQMNITLSPQFVYSQAKQIDNAPDEEGTTFSFIMEALKEYGVCRESDVEYNPQHDWGQMAQFEARRYDPRQIKKLSKQFRVLQYEHLVDATDVESIKSLLFKGHAVGLAVPVFQDAWYNNYTGRRGEVQLPLFREGKLLDALRGGHAITLYGYVDDGAEDFIDDADQDSGHGTNPRIGDDEEDNHDEVQVPRAGGGYFIFRNTWGTGWGSSQLDCPSGYGMLPYAYVRLLALDAVIVTSEDTMATILIFTTDTGLEIPAITTEQMREVDRVAVEETGPNLYQMMENAGRNLATLALEILGEGWRSARVVALAGSGGNGGGAICGARHLVNRGMNVRLCLSSPDRLGEVPTWQRCIYQAAGGREATIDQLDQEPVDLILDGVIGYSLLSAPHGLAAGVIDWANAQTEARILSLDVPSGVDATTGETLGVYMRSHTTLTLALPKTGLLPDKTGDLLLADLGIPRETYTRVGITSYRCPFDHRFYVPLLAC